MPALLLSPSVQRIFVGGEFTLVNGQRTPHLVALSVANARQIPQGAHTPGFP